MGRTGRIAREHVDFVRDILGAARNDSTIEAVKENVQTALEVLEPLPGGTQTTPRKLRRSVDRWYGRRHRRPERL